jgi:hypothetical protein
MPSATNCLFGGGGAFPRLSSGIRLGGGPDRGDRLGEVIILVDGRTIEILDELY